MYVICWTTLGGQNQWEIVNSVDAMQERVLQLEKELKCDADDILVFDTDNQIE